MAEEAKAVVERWFSALNQGKAAALAAIDTLYTPDYTVHYGSIGSVRGTASIREQVESLFGGLDDLRFTVHDTMTEGDRVMTRYTFAGVHARTLMGVPPTGRRVEGSAIAISRVQGGQIVEVWAVFDAQNFLEQLRKPKTVQAH